jgi:cell division protein FtsI/penicillin-binding protein 2
MMNAGWVKGDTVNLGIGQGYLVTTPMQLANYASLLATKGQFTEPSLVSLGTQKKPLKTWKMMDLIIQTGSKCMRLYLA